VRSQRWRTIRKREQSITRSWNIICDCSLSSLLLAEIKKRGMELIGYMPFQFFYELFLSCIFLLLMQYQGQTKTAVASVCSLSHSLRGHNTSQIDFNIHRDDIQFSEFIDTLDPRLAYKIPFLSLLMQSKLFVVELLQ
jgi:hypothetical protein